MEWQLLLAPGRYGCRRAGHSRLNHCKAAFLRLPAAGQGVVTRWPSSSTSRISIPSGGLDIRFCMAADASSALEVGLLLTFSAAPPASPRRMSVLLLPGVRQSQRLAALRPAILSCCELSASEKCLNVLVLARLAV